MADSKLSALPELATTPAATDEFYINDGTVSKRIQYSNLGITAGFTSIIDDETYANYAIGLTALDSLTAGSGLRNVAIGEGAGTAITTGDCSVCIGYKAGIGIVATGESVAIGANTSTGSLNSAVVIGSTITNGEQTGGSSQCTSSVVIGHQAGKAMYSNNVSQVLIGYRAGQNITTGSSNICIGATASGPTTGMYCLQISTSACSLPSLTDNYQILIGTNSTVILPFIQGYFPSGEDNSSRQTFINGPCAQLNLTSGNVHGGDLVLRGGLASTTSAGVGGDLYLRAGTGGSTGSNGLVIMDNLPTSDPTVAGALWNNSGVLTVSAG